jgi:hypothetical protein
MPESRRSNLAAADAALLGWLEFAARHDQMDAESIDAFIDHGRLLCSGGGGRRRIEGRLVDEWRVLAARGVDLIGPAFDPENTMKVWGPRRKHRLQELGRRLLESDGVPPDPTGKGTPAWWTWKRQAADWAREEDHWRRDARRRFAGERIRLGLEAAWAEPAGGPESPDRTAAPDTR